MGWRTWTGAFGAAVTLAAAAAIAVPAGASAGIYHVYACRTPAGAPAPADGWSASASGSLASAENTCAQALGGLVAGFPELGYPAGTEQIASWRFEAAAPERLVGVRLWRAGDVEGGFSATAEYVLWIGGASRASAFEECVAGIGGCLSVGDQAAPLSSANVLVPPPASIASGVSVNAECAGRQTNCPGRALPPRVPDGFAAELVLYAADETLEQQAGPSVADVGGALATAATVGGESSVSFTASDPGAGVYEALVSVDGVLVERVPLDDNGGRCGDAGGTSNGSAAFLYIRPCASTVSTSVALDTTALQNGAHDVGVSVTDAAGNTATVLERRVTVANGAPCATGGGASAAAMAGAPAADGTMLNASWGGARSAAITTAFARAHTIEGTVTRRGGAPVAGARVEAFSLTSGAASSAVASAVAVTDAAGRFSVRVGAGGPSRTVCVAYFAGAGSGVATRTLRMNVRAPVALSISPRHVSVGGTIRFRGRLLGGHLPAGGKQVILEARSAGSGWIEFKVVRANARGRFRAAYRFRFPGPATYEFRALCEAEADYPFARGASNAVRVRER